VTSWLEVVPGAAPLVVSLPHTGTEIDPAIEDRLNSAWLARKDADWHVEKLYAFAADLGATFVRTAVSRTVVDVNRDPSGASLYPGRATTELCPLTSFDGEPLYRPGAEPDADEIAERRRRFFDPYHAALGQEIERLRASHPAVVLYEAHSIRSRIPRLFDGELPHLNIGTNGGATCADALASSVAATCAASGFSHVLDGRFRGGWTTRRYGRPDAGVHAVQMELACRGYLDEPDAVAPGNWPPPYDPARAARLRATLVRVLESCITFAKEQA